MNEYIAEVIENYHVRIISDVEKLSLQRIMLFHIDNIKCNNLNTYVQVK